MSTEGTRTGEGGGSGRVPPRYAELPLLEEGSDYRHAWDWFGPDDNLGALANLTPDARLRGLASATDGVTVGLCLPLNEPSPPMFGREPFTHTVFRSGRNNMDDKLDGFYLQGSTQWDGFRHVQARQHGFFTGLQREFEAADDGRLGVGHWAATGIVGRGVLLDLGDTYARSDVTPPASPEVSFGADDLRRAVDDMVVERGDVLCVRTGWMANYLAAPAQHRAQITSATTWPGLGAGPDVAELLWDWGVAAVAVDNPAVEVAPGSPKVGSLHRRLMPLLGIPLGELFDFEQLSRECRDRGRATFLFCSVPLNLTGGVGSPGNAVAVL